MNIVKVSCVNSMGKTDRCKNAGDKIISLLDSFYSSESGKPLDRRLLDIEEISVDNKNLEEQEISLYENSLNLLSDKCIFLEEDDSVSFSIGKAFLESSENPCLIVFDAHADCCKPGKEPTHEEWLRALIEAGFPAENVLLIGARNVWKEEIEFLSKNNIRRININELNNNLEEVTDVIMEFSSGKEVYVSLDIDVVDPAFAPGTGYKEVGGLTSRQILYIVSRLALMKNLKVFDIVEIDASDEATVKLGAKIWENCCDRFIYLGFYYIRMKINRVILLLVISDILILSSFGLIVPIFAIFLNEGIAGGSIAAAGLASAIFLIVKSGLQLPFSIYLDKKKDKIIFLLLGTFFIVTVPLIYAFAPHVRVIYFGQVLYGIGAAMAYPAWYCLFVAHLDKRHEGLEYSLWSTGVGVGSAITAYLGALAAKNYGFRNLFFVVSGLSFIGMLILFLLSKKFLKEVDHKTKGIFGIKPINHKK